MNPTLAAEISALRRQSPLRWLGAAAVDWATIVVAMAGAHAAAHWGAYLAAAFVIATRQYALTLLGHDGTHGLITRRRRVNDALTALLVWWPIGVGLDRYRASHFAHHRHLGTVRDPEASYKRESAPAWDLPVSRWRHLRNLLADLTFANAQQALHLTRTFGPASRRDLAGVGLVWSAFVGVLAWTGQWWVLGMWLLPMASMTWALHRLRIWTEHSGVPGTHRFAAGPLWRMLLFPHHSYCHWEHHNYPTVPLHNLDRVRALAEGPEILPSPAALFLELERAAPTSTRAHAEAGASAPDLASVRS